jgi:hypothetical protein
MPPFDFIKFGEDEALFAFDMIIEFGVIFRVREFSSRMCCQLSLLRNSSLKGEALITHLLERK